MIFTLFYRFGVRIPLRPFFTVTSVLLYYMAFVFIGKGFRELQEGNVVPITPINGLPTIEALGFYPTWQTLIAQLVARRAVRVRGREDVLAEAIGRAADGGAGARDSPASAIDAELQRLRAENEAV